MNYATRLSAAVLLTLPTIWLQCGAIAALITWAKARLADDIERRGLFQITALVVRLVMAVVVLHLCEVLVWAAFYRVACLPSWSTALYFSAGSYGTVGCSDVSLPSNWRSFGPLESITGVLMCGISVSLLFATMARFINATKDCRRDGTA